jgi:hypothetical protein
MILFAGRDDLLHALALELLSSSGYGVLPACDGRQTLEGRS